MIFRLNGVMNTLYGLSRTSLLSDASGIPRMLLGYQAGGFGAGKDFGIKVSQPGVDVSQAVDSQLIFKMDLESWIWYDGGLESAVIGKIS